MPIQVLNSSGNILSSSPPSGSDTQVQFNDDGSFGGDAGLTYNKTTDTLTITGDLGVNGGDLTSTAATFNLLNATVTTLNIGGAATVIGLGAASTVLTLGSNATINGGSAANDDLTLQGTSNATRTTSYVLLQPNGGNVGIGTAGPFSRLSNTGSNVLDRGPGLGSGTLTTGIIWSVSGQGYVMGIENTDATAVVRSGLTVRTAATDADSNIVSFASGTTQRFVVRSDGNVGIGTVGPGNPLAVNRAADGVIVDFESGDVVQGNVSISGATTTYAAFLGSHYTQLKAGQVELPVGTVVISTGEIVPCQAHKATETLVPANVAVTIVNKADAVEQYQAEVEDQSVVVSTETTYEYDPETDSEKEVVKVTYGTRTETRRRLKEGVKFHKRTRNFYRVKVGYIEKEDGFYQTGEQAIDVSGKEYFPYVDTTNVPADKRVYGVWFSKMSEDSKGQSFGQDALPVYLIAQVGLFKVRVTDTTGNIANGDYLETSSRPMEAQKQTLAGRRNSTLAKSLVDVDWSTVPVDPALGYKWKLIPAIF